MIVTRSAMAIVEGSPLKSLVSALFGDDHPDPAVGRGVMLIVDERIVVVVSESAMVGLQSRFDEML